jgi:hypothetical protein
MRCENCGHPMKNAEMWKLGGDRDAPTARSMHSLCWDCRTQAQQTADAADAARKEADAEAEKDAGEAPYASAMVA